MVQVSKSERLAYTQMDRTDAAQLWALDQDEAVMRYINGGKPTSRSDIDEVMIPRLYAYRNPEKGWGLWKVLRLEDHIFLGWILVRPMHFFDENRDDSDLEIGWRFHQKHWGHGYATEAARAVMDGIRTQTGVLKFSAIALKENTASINIMKKLGMAFIKRERYKDPLMDSVVDFYSIALSDSTPA